LQTICHGGWKLQRRSGQKGSRRIEGAALLRATATRRFFRAGGGTQRMVAEAEMH